MKKLICLATLAAALAAPGVLQGQASKWVVDSNRSLVWWQMNPHFGHLWATTCPADPSWQPGEGAHLFGDDHVKPKRTSLAQHTETRIPLYPRLAVSPVCGSAVRGEITVRDTMRWQGAQGRIAVKAAELVNGQDMRDNFARRRVYEVDQYPEIRFHLDSLANPVRTDSLALKAYGQFEFRGKRRPVVVPVTAVREGTGLRVRGYFNMNPADLTREYGISKLALGLGAGQRLWNTLHWGMDLILRQEP